MEDKPETQKLLDMVHMFTFKDFAPQVSPYDVLKAVTSDIQSLREEIHTIKFPLE